MTDSGEQPRVLELVGLAGAGKTTLEHLLHLRDPRIRPIVAPGKASYIPFLARKAGLWLSTLLWRRRGNRWFTPDEMRLIGYLEVWASHLRVNERIPGSVIVLNPGSIYWLAALRECGPACFESHSCGEWWDAMIDEWAALLDLAVWLDAPDSVLLERVHSRPQWHEAKAQSDSQVLERFALLRRRYGYILDEMAARDGPVVLQFRTDRVSPEQIADSVLVALRLLDTSPGGTSAVEPAVRWGSVPEG